ncbi:DUF5958 family protein [Larkinella sp. VNQ87]|uniref:DUF5958 family protein n=1 Tax=Larkinella sp. VNQ87 TaxID=3400921 RepID=UPI003BFC9733
MGRKSFFMSLEEEITLRQFGQDILTDEVLLQRFAQFSDNDRHIHLMDLYFLVASEKPLDSDLEPAITASSLPDTDVTAIALRTHGLQRGLNHLANLSEKGYENGYKLLLYVFKMAYQRHFAQEKDHATKWQYQDLSRPGMMQEIRDRQQTLAEEVYQHPGFRNEFLCIAKLHHAEQVARQTHPALTPASGNEPTVFITYDEMITNGIRHFEEQERYSRPAWLLFNALRKAIIIQYRIDDDQARRALWDVVERHMQEQYQTSLFD